CFLLSVLQTIFPFALRCKLQARSDADNPLLNRLYLSCFREHKDAVVVAGSEELHLVATPSKVEKVSISSESQGIMGGIGEAELCERTRKGVARLRQNKLSSR
ncbi:unnamed protein product, partial [Musa hybrid cultivar]